MSLLSVLKTLGHDLGTFGGWIENALPVAGSILAVVDPPLVPIITTVESVLNDLTTATGKIPTSDELETLTKAVTTLQSVQSIIQTASIAKLTTSSTTKVTP